MSKYSSAKDGATGEGKGSTSRRRLADARLYLRETLRGTWVVHEESDRRGGSFFTREAALKFIRREFGTHAHIVTLYVMHKTAA